MDISKYSKLIRYTNYFNSKLGYQIKEEEYYDREGQFVEAHYYERRNKILSTDNYGYSQITPDRLLQHKTGINRDIERMWKRIFNQIKR